jgi:MFS family permease
MLFVITYYAIANVIVIPMTSWLSQQFGRRNYFAVSIIIFTVSSFCGNATNIWELVALDSFKVLAVAHFGNASNYNRKLSACETWNGAAI